MTYEEVTPTAGSKYTRSEFSWPTRCYYLFQGEVWAWIKSDPISQEGTGFLVCCHASTWRSLGGVKGEAGERERAAANRHCKLYCLGLTPGLSPAFFEAGLFTLLESPDPLEILVNLVKSTPPVGWRHPRKETCF